MQAQLSRNLGTPTGHREVHSPVLLSGVVDHCAVISRGMTLTVAERARALIIALR
jgi:hypothetical protein